MTRLNLNVVWLTTLFSLLCYSEAKHHAYGRYFVDAMETIHHRGLEEIDRQTLFDAAVQGMAREHDNYSAFIPRSERDDYVAELDQHLSGIGILVEQDRETGTIMVMNTIIGKPHPAYDAGMRSGDQIVAIEGVTVAGKSLSEAVAAIHGPVGERVAITVIHAGQDEPVELSVLRLDIAVDSVLGDSRDTDGQWDFRLAADPRIAYIRLTTFGDRTVSELQAALTYLKKENQLNALIVDVRDNAGGYLDAADEICNLFIPEGVIVTTRGRKGRVKEVRKATQAGTFDGFPMVVLVNGESASASEIFAGCMQDYGRAVVVGSRTFGKGSVQQMIPMENNRSILKLTTASYWRPSGRNIHRLKTSTADDPWGVQPDEGFDLVLTSEQQRDRIKERRQRDAMQIDPPPSSVLPDADPQLRSAVEYLQEQLDGDATDSEAARPANNDSGSESGR